MEYGGRGWFFGITNLEADYGDVWDSTSSWYSLMSSINFEKFFLPESENCLQGL